MDPIQAAHVAKIVRMCQLISTAVALYDHLLTLGQEVELVWNKPRTLARSMFLWNRYFGSLFLLINGILFSIPSYGDLCVLIDLHFSSDAHFRGMTQFNIQLLSLVSVPRMWNCNHHLVNAKCVLHFVLQLLSLELSAGTMLLRTHAMYPYSSYIRRATWICFICEVVSMAIILVFAFIKFKASNLGIPASSFCTTYNIPSFLYAFWIPVIALDCIFFLLTVWFVLVHRHRGADALASPNLILKTLVRDSISYFFVSLLTYVANAAVWIILPARLIGLPQAFSIAGACIMGIRLVLNLRGAYYSQSMDSMSYDDRVAANPITPDADASTISVTFRVPSRISTVSSKMEDFSYP